MKLEIIKNDILVTEEKKATMAPFLWQLNFTCKPKVKRKAVRALNHCPRKTKVMKSVNSKIVLVLEMSQIPFACNHFN